MSRLHRKLIATIVMFTVFMQPFAPQIALWASNSRSAQIADAKAKFQDTYNKIKSIKPIDLNAVNSFILNATSWGTNAVSDEPDVDYVAQIEKANKDIEKAQTDADRTMELLNAGDLEGAAAADPTAAGNNLVETGGAAQIYQDAMCKAGSTLSNVGNMLADIGLVMQVVAGVLAIAATVLLPSAPVLLPAAKLIWDVGGALGIVGPVIAAAGDALTEAGMNGITSDWGIIGCTAKHVGPEVIKQVILKKVLPGVSNKVMKKLANNKILSKLWSPKSSLVNWIKNSKLMQSAYARNFNPGSIDRYTAGNLWTQHLNKINYGDIIADAGYAGYQLGYKYGIPKDSPAKKILPPSIPASIPGYTVSKVTEFVSGTLNGKPAASGGGGGGALNETPSYQQRKTGGPGL